MGKSVLLQDIEARLAAEHGTRVVLVPGPPEDATVPGAVQDLALRLGIRDLERPRMDDLIERVVTGSIQRFVALFDEVDQYVTAGGEAEVAFTRSWFNRLEVMRKQYDGMFDVVFAGGLGLFFLEREIGSGIVSRAEPCLLTPFSLAEIAQLSEPFAGDGRPLDERCLETLLALSGGSPALVTYGLESLWNLPAPAARDLERAFGAFRHRHADFLRAISASISQRGRLNAPWRVLECVRESAGALSRTRLREACAAVDGERIQIDPEQALDLLGAAGLVSVEGSPLADPVAAWPVASILNLPEVPAAAGRGGAAERLIEDLCAVLRHMRRFGRDFHDRDGLVEEQVLSSLIAVGLMMRGWIRAGSRTCTGRGPARHQSALLAAGFRWTRHRRGEEVDAEDPQRGHPAAGRRLPPGRHAAWDRDHARRPRRGGLARCLRGVVLGRA